MFANRILKACGRSCVLGFLLAACQPALSENKALVVQWPAHAGVRNDRPAMVLKVPPEYAMHAEVVRDERGAARMYIRFSMPGPKPAYKPAAGSMRTAEEVTKARLVRRRANINLTLVRDGGGEFEAEDNIRTMVEGQVAGKYFWPDGELHGLKRYSQLKCVNQEEAWNREQLKNKPADDTSPAGCFVWRQNMFLLPVTPTRRDDEWVYVQCVTGQCDASFSFRGIRASLNLWVEELPEWRERVDASRKIIELIASN